MSAQTAAMFFMGIELIIVFFLVVVLPVFIIYKLAKRLIEHRVEYQYRYDEYKAAEAELNDIEADLRRHQEEDC